MKFLGVGAASLAMASTALAGPQWGDWSDSAAATTVTSGEPSWPTGSACPTDTCLQQADAEEAVAKFISIVDHPDVAKSNATAQAFLADTFFEESDSIDTLAGFPLGSVTFKGKQEYLGSLLNSPSLTNITTLQVMPAGCTNVIWFWKMFVGSEQLEVKGFNLMQISTSGQLLGQFVEFNSIAWGTDTGYSCYNATGAKLPTA